MDAVAVAVAAAQASRRFVQITDGPLVITDRRFGVDPTGATPWNVGTQAAIDLASAALDGHGQVYAPDGHYTNKLLDIDDLGGIILPSDIVFEGSGRDRCVVENDLSAVQVGDPLFRWFTMRVGTIDTSASNITVSGMHFIVNSLDVPDPATAGNHRIFGLGCRHDNIETIEAVHNDNVRFEKLRITGAMLSILSQKNGSVPQSHLLNRVLAQHQSWTVDDCIIEDEGNKAVQFGETTNGKVLNSVFRNCVDGPQAITNSRGMVFLNNRIGYTSSGINLAASCADVKVLFNWITYEGTSQAATRGGLVFRTEGINFAQTITDVLSSGNHYSDRVTDDANLIGFITYPELTGANRATYENIRSIGDHFEGTVNLREIGLNAAQATLRNVRITDADFLGDVLTDPLATVDASRLRLRGCDFRGRPLVWNASDSSIQDCEGLTDVTVNGDRNRILQNELETLTDLGADNIGTLADQWVL